MSDLRALIKAFPWHDRWTDDGDEYVLERAVLALIPEGAVLVTEETLAAAMMGPLIETGMRFRWPLPPEPYSDVELLAAAILRHLREGT